MSFVIFQLVAQIVFTPINTLLLYKVIGRDVEYFGQRFGEKNPGFELTLPQCVGFSAASAFVAGSAMYYTPDYQLLMLSFILYWIIILYYFFQLPQKLVMNCASLLIVVDDVILAIVHYALKAIL